MGLSILNNKTNNMKKFIIQYYGWIPSYRDFDMDVETISAISETEALKIFFERNKFVKNYSIKEIKKPIKKHGNMKRTSTYICTIPFKNEEQVLETKKTLVQIFGWVVLRGRNSDRKKVLGSDWRKWNQNDIPWRKAETIAVYLHPKNPNYQSVADGKGIKRMNLDY